MTNYPKNGRELVFLGPLKESWGFANLFTTRQHKNVGQRRDFSCNMGRLKLVVVILVFSYYTYGIKSLFRIDLDLNWIFLPAVACANQV